jgi:hypothetical protein
MVGSTKLLLYKLRIMFGNSFVVMLVHIFLMSNEASFMFCRRGCPFVCISCTVFITLKVLGSGMCFCKSFVIFLANL